MGFLQDRMSRSHQEQVWAVALVGGLNSLVINQGKLLAAAIGQGRLALGLALTCLLGLLFLWSRHFIYRHYDGILRELVERDPQARAIQVNGFKRGARTLIGWTGIGLYSLILLATTWAALAVLRQP